MSENKKNKIGLGRAAIAEMMFCGGGGASALVVKAWADTILSALNAAEAERDELANLVLACELFPELAAGDTTRRDEQRVAYNGLRWVLGLLAGLDDKRDDSVARTFRPVVEKIRRDRDEARDAERARAEEADAERARAEKAEARVRELEAIAGASALVVKTWADTISRALDSAEAELARPTFQCSDCGSTGPFRDVVYPNTPNGPEEYDTECVECGSLQIEESPRCAFSRAVNRLDEEKGAALERAEEAEARVRELEAIAESRADGARDEDQERAAGMRSRKED